MAVLSKQPLVSFVVPTLNSELVLFNCLKSIISQKFDQKKIEIVVCDGGSIDSTPKIAKSFNSKIFFNPLKTAESGKALGIKNATGKYVVLIDSDNILPTPNWLKKMLLPFNNPAIIGAEPWNYTYRRSGGFIERYSALTGANDPYSLVIGNYDRKSILHTNWNGLDIPVVDRRCYQSFALRQPLPSIGANGTVYRKNIIKKYLQSSYLIDVDLPILISQKPNDYLFAKVKCGIIHTYCESSISKFAKKQNRRVIDLYTYQNLRPRLFIKSQLIKNIKFGLYVISIFPMVFDTIRGFIKKPDPAWFFHPLACIITLYIYTINTIKYKIGILKPLNRQQWHQ